jgi:hypothetical protein
MNNFSKLMLSAEEQQLVNNSGWILTKRIIIDKVNQLMGFLSENQKAFINQEIVWLPSAAVQSTPKISKGENYLRLPYVLLDYPRCFDAGNIFAVRTMFWWGNFFSMTLHLSGTYKQKFQEKIIKNLGKSKQHYFICINQNQWQHHFEADNYIPVNQLSPDALQFIILEKQFLKLAIKFQLQQWNDQPALLDESFREIIEMLKD